MKIGNFENFEKINEATSRNFVIDKQTKNLESGGNHNSREYWMRGGDAEGTIDTEIEVFGYNHEEEAKLLYDALAAAGLQDRYYKISIEVK